MTRRTNALIRILGYTLLILIIFAFFVVLMAGNFINYFNFSFLPFGNNINFYYDDGSYIATDGGEYTFPSVNDIEVHWVYGNVTLRESNVDYIKVYEDNKDVTDDTVFYYKQEGNKLIIQFCKSSKLRSFTKGLRDKHLYIEVPKAEILSSLSIESVTADVKVNDVSASSHKYDVTTGKVYLDSIDARSIYLSATTGDIKMSNLMVEDVIKIDSTTGDAELYAVTAAVIKADTVTGDVFAQDTNTDKLEFDSTTGRLEYSGSVESAEIETTTGKAALILDKMPASVKGESSSGRFELTLPENSGFSIMLDTTSGKIKSEFDIGSSSKRGTYKNGGADLEFDTTSGNVILKRK